MSAAAVSLVDKWNRQRIHHQHKHPPVRNVNRVEYEMRTTGQRIADTFATLMGSWPFIIIQSVLLLGWIALNVMAYWRHWDPYPFILLNLALSFQAAYAAPIIMMSQNRQATKDRIAAEHDYEINVKAEEEVKGIMGHLEQQDELMLDILHRMEQQHLVMLESLKTVGSPQQHERNGT